MSATRYGWSASFTPLPGRAGEPSSVNLVPDATIAGAAGDGVSLMDTSAAVQVIKGMLGARPVPIRYAEPAGPAKAGTLAGVMTALSFGGLIWAASIEWDSEANADLSAWLLQGGRPSLVLSQLVGYALTLVPPPAKELQPAAPVERLATAGAAVQAAALARFRSRLREAQASLPANEAIASGVCFSDEANGRSASLIDSETSQ